MTGLLDPRPSPASAPPERPRPTADDVQPCTNETRDRIITGAITVGPVLALGIAGWQLWEEALRPSDLVVLGVLYLLTGLGVTLGFHRLLTHRSFTTTRWMRGTLAALGSMAVEGPVVSWVADHRKHHAFSDAEGDPHSPHVGHSSGWRGALAGLAHAHVGWIFIHTHRAAKRRYAPDLLADPVVSWVDRTFIGWALLSIFALPFALGWLIGGSLAAGLTGMLWGGAVRMMLLHHATYSINSLCHFFGRRRFATGDESRNLGWLALVTFGEAWHNNHHAFPTSAAHGLRRRELDPTAWAIGLLERAGLAWDVVRVSPDKQARRALEA